jgi:5-(aminomethyl)-3-furanmethanol phosphate kinase
VDTRSATGLVVVKVGGSLFDLPDLGPRLRAWLKWLHGAEVLLVPGGGPTADVVRAFDRGHALGEEAAHWLALRALTLNAHFLQAVLPEAAIVPQPHGGGLLAILDPYLFVCADEGKAGCLPHCWEVTSDAVAARAAVVVRARRLVLLKSVTIPEGMAWDEAGRCGLVDSWFARVLEQAPVPLTVSAVNIRCQSAGPENGPLDSGCGGDGRR